MSQRRTPGYQITKNSNMLLSHERHFPYTFVLSSLFTPNIVSGLRRPVESPIQHHSPGWGVSFSFSFFFKKKKLLRNVVRFCLLTSNRGGRPIPSTPPSITHTCPKAPPPSSAARLMDFLGWPEIYQLDVCMLPFSQLVLDRRNHLLGGGCFDERGSGM